MNKIIITLFLLILSPNVFCQNANIWDVAEKVTWKICKTICPNTGKDAKYEITSNEDLGYYRKLEIESQWTGAACGLCSWETYYTREIVYIKSSNFDIVKIEVVNKSRNVDEVWSSSDITAGLAALVVTSAAINKYSSSGSSQSSSNNNSSNYSSSSNNTGFKYSVGCFGKSEDEVSKASGEGWIGGVFFRNKYIIRINYKVDSRKIEEGIAKYQLLIYSIEVGYASNWVSLNNIKGMNSFEQEIKDKFGKYVGRYTKFKSENEIYNDKIIFNCN